MIGLFREQFPHHLSNGHHHPVRSRFEVRLTFLHPTLYQLVLLRPFPSILEMRLIPMNAATIFPYAPCSVDPRQLGGLSVGGHVPVLLPQWVADPCLAPHLVRRRRGDDVGGGETDRAIRSDVPRTPRRCRRTFFAAFIIFTESCSFPS